MDFYVQTDMVITNTFYKVPARRRYTWKAPGDVKRYQIDFILVKEKYRNQFKSSHTYPGLDVDSDHNLVLAKCNIRFKNRSNMIEKKWCIDQLKCNATINMFKEELGTLNKHGMKS